MFKKIIIFLLFFTPLSSYAIGVNDDVSTDIYSATAGLADIGGFDVDDTVEDIMSKVFEAFLGLLGIILIVMILTAGYTWMTANGDEQKVTKAKDTIQKAIIGLIIILSAYAITAFVFSAMSS